MVKQQLWPQPSGTIFTSQRVQLKESELHDTFLFINCKQKDTCRKQKRNANNRAVEH